MGVTQPSFDDVPDRPDPERPIPGKVKRDNPETSRRAARSVRYRAGSHRALILEALRRAGARGLTNAEAAAAVNNAGALISRNHAATRMQELHEDGWAKVLLDADGAPVERPTDREGRNTGIVHVHVDQEPF